MKNYELMIVFHPDLEMNVDPALEKVKQTLEANQAKITKEEVDGKRRLAYKIGKLEFGLYYYFELELPPEAPGKISEVFNINDEIIRYMLAKADERRLKLAEKRAARVTEGSEAAAESAATSAESAEAAIKDAPSVADTKDNTKDNNKEEA